jgi:hypothetical protein
LAEATKREAEVREEIELLGYRRIELKDAEESANHEVRLAENDFELTKELYIRASQATEIARAHSRTILQEYVNKVQEEIIALKAALEKEGVSFKLDTSYERQKMDAEATIEYQKHEEELIKDNLLATLINMAAVAVDNCKTTRDSAEQRFRTASFTIRAQRVQKGTANISEVGGSGEIGTGACQEPTE